MYLKDIPSSQANLSGRNALPSRSHQALCFSNSRLGGSFTECGVHNRIRDRIKEWFIITPTACSALRRVCIRFERHRIWPERRTRVDDRAVKSGLPRLQSGPLMPSLAPLSARHHLQSCVGGSFPLADPWQRCSCPLASRSGRGRGLPRQGQSRSGAECGSRWPSGGGGR